jgi:hypothetical protein
MWTYGDGVAPAAPTSVDSSASTQRRQKRGFRSGIGLRYTYYLFLLIMILPSAFK